MAILCVERDQLVLHLSWKEKVGGLHGDVRVPLSSVRAVSVITQPWLALRGWRMAGTGIPGLVALGTRRHGEGYDFTALYRSRPAVQVEVATGRFSRLVVSVTDEDQARSQAASIASAAGIRLG